MIHILKNQIVRNLVNIPGWRTNRKIVVIESDDWGSIRMPSKEVYNQLLRKGIKVDKCPYNRYDSLADQDDLNALFEVLSSVRDQNGNPAVLTANTIVANPDFAKIKYSNFEEYHYELFTDTLKRYSKGQEVFNLWQEGISKGFFHPQFHGREHLNVRYWMNELRNGNKELLTAFDMEMFGIPLSTTVNNRDNYMAAFDTASIEHQKEVLDTVVDGLRLFNVTFGYRSETLMAPCYIWPRQIESVLYEVGIKAFQGILNQFEPNLKKGKAKKIIHFIGQKNKIGQRYLVRNAFFEPSHFPNIDYVGEIIERLKTSFFWKKPAIISTHRLNFIGSLDEKNRKINLEKLEHLLKAIVKEWPDVEFKNSSDLIRIINKEKSDD